MKSHPCFLPSVRRRRTGSVLVEAAMVLTFVLLPLFLGMLQFGLYLNATSSVVNLAREGARYAAVQSDATASSVQTYITSPGIIPAQLRANRITTSPGGVALQYYAIDGTASATRIQGGRVRVTLIYDMRDKLIGGSKLFGAVLGSTYVATATFRVETAA